MHTTDGSVTVLALDSQRARRRRAWRPRGAEPRPRRLREKRIERTVEERPAAEFITFVVCIRNLRHPHRISTVRRADRVLVLNAGRIVAEGACDQLLGTSSLHRELCVQLGVNENDSPAVLRL